MNMTVTDSSSTLSALSRQDSSELRSILFRHLDGFPIAPTIAALHKNKVLDLFSLSNTIPLEHITDYTQGNEGYLQVAMRLLCSQGWLVQAVNSRKDTVKYTTTCR